MSGPEVELLVHPDRAAGSCGTGVLVLAGSSGALEVERARLLAAYGATALALRWFGGRANSPDPSRCRWRPLPTPSTGSRPTSTGWPCWAPPSGPRLRS